MIQTRFLATKNDLSEMTCHATMPIKMMICMVP